MSCPYYWWNNHYACRKSGKDVNDDIYGRYCKSYSYDDCPIYKNEDSSSSGGCFLTTACVEARGLPDNCHELTTLRSFRDGYMRSLPNGDSEICEYYFTAPQIIRAIMAEENPSEVFDSIYAELVSPCVKLVESGENAAAHELYSSYVLMLKDRYLMQ